MYFVTIYNKEEAEFFEMLLNQLWLSFEKKRDGFFKVVADAEDFVRVRDKVKWDKVLKVA